MGGQLFSFAGQIRPLFVFRGSNLMSKGSYWILSRAGCCPSWGQYHQRSMSSLYSRRSQRCKKRVNLSVFFVLLGSASCSWNLYEIDIWGRFHQRFSRAFFACDPERIRKRCSYEKRCKKRVRKMLVKSTPGLHVMFSDSSTLKNFSLFGDASGKIRQIWQVSISPIRWHSNDTWHSRGLIKCHMNFFSFFILWF